MAPETGQKGHHRPAKAPKPYAPVGARADDWASKHPLDPEEKIDLQQILDDLERYRPRRRGWTWRTPMPGPAPGPVLVP